MMAAANRLEKLALNNQIVRMRKDVKRARLWLINSLTHRMKRLTGTKTNELEKNQHKAEKLRNELYLLKQLCIDEVSKFAICNKKELSNLSLKESELDLSQKLLLQLSNHRLVQQQVEVFRQTYTGPMDRLVLLVRSLGLQYQKRKLKKLVDGVTSGNTKGDTKIANDSQYTPERKKFISMPKLEETTSSGCIVNSLSILDSHLPPNLGIQDESKEKKDDVSHPLKVPYRVMNKTKPLADLLQTKGNCTAVVSLKKNSGKTSEISFAKNSNVENQPNSKGNSAQKIPWPKLSVLPVNKKVGTMIIKQLHLDSEAVAISFGESNVALDTGPKINQPPRDSFFLGGVDLPSDDECINKDSMQSNAKRVKKMTKWETKATQDKTNRSGYQSSNGPSQTEHKITLPVSRVEVLHPSWQAKRKEKEQQINIGVCQGKKIRFDDY